MELYVYDGDYGLPSFDIECIKSILFAKIAKVPITTKLMNNIKNCCFYEAPSLVDGNVTVTGFKNIIKYLRTLHYNIDCGLSSKQASDLCAVESLVITKLRPVLVFLQWVDNRNCDELSSPWYMKALPFPFNYLHLKRKRQFGLELTSALYPNENDEAVREFLRKSASNTLSILSTRLGTSQYFYGDFLTTLDVIVYAHIAPFMKIPFISTEISSLITMWPNLMNFVKNIDSKYFSDLSSQPKYLKKPEKVKQNDDDLSYAALFVLFTGASTIMFCFALNKGLTLIVLYIFVSLFSN